MIDKVRFLIGDEKIANKDIYLHCFIWQPEAGRARGSGHHLSSRRPDTTKEENVWAPPAPAEVTTSPLSEFEGGQRGEPCPVELLTRL